MNELRKTAVAFGWDVSTMANVMGYTRQGLYTAIRRKEVQTVRMSAALQHLSELSQLQYEEQMEKADTLRKIRNENIAGLADKFGLCFETEENDE